MADEMQLPARVRIGAHVFEIEKWEPLEAHGARRYGEICYLVQKIRVDTQHLPHRVANTLLHEILHGACNIGGFCKRDNPSEEEYVTQIADVLTQVWQDNRDVMTWIGENLQLPED